MSAQSPVVAILLAAGESRRMGRPKPLLEWKGLTLIEYQIRELHAAGVDEVIAVLGARADEVRPAAQRAGARIVLNAAYREGRAGSIRAGAFAIQDRPEVILLLSVDQPRGRNISSALLKAHLDKCNLITVPTHGGRRGHPAVLAGSLLNELRNVREETEGLRALMQRHAAERAELALDNPDVLLDLNRPEEYEAALAQREE